MRKWWQRLSRLWRNEAIQPFFEFFLVVVLVAVSVVVALTLLGEGIQNTMKTFVAAI